MNKIIKRDIYKRLANLLGTYKLYLRNPDEFNFYTASALNMSYRTSGWSVIGAYYLCDVITYSEYDNLTRIWAKVINKYDPNLTL